MAKSAAPLLLVAGAAFLFMGGKKKKKPPKACPPIVHIAWENLPTETLIVEFEGGESGEVKLSKTAYRDALSGNRNIIDIASKALAPFIPVDCFSSDSVKVDIVAGDGSRLSYKAVELFFLFSTDLLESLYSAGLFSKDETQYSSNELTKWWVSNMGEAPLPED